MEEYKRKQDEREGIVRDKPKGWARVKKHVEWKPGFHCAVCMTGKVTGRLKPCGHRSICVGCYEEYVNDSDDDIERSLRESSYSKPSQRKFIKYLLIENY